MTKQPLVALPSAVVLPGAVITAEVQRPHNLRALEQARTPTEGVVERCIVAPLDDPEGEITPQGVLGVGTLVRVISRVTLSGGSLRVVLHGLRRVRLEDIEEVDGHLRADGVEVQDQISDPDACLAELEQLSSLISKLALVDSHYPEDLVSLVEHNSQNPSALSDLLAGQLPLDYGERARHLAEADASLRLRHLRRHLSAALQRAQVGHDVEGVVREGIRRSYLKQQLQILRDELGEPDPQAAALELLGEHIDKTPLSEAAYERALHDLESLRRALPNAPSTTRLHNYLEWMLELPWFETENLAPVSNERFEAVVDALERSHCGLAEVKTRLIEFIAVHRLHGEARGTVLCFSGPPGTGKSSMGRAVADALARPFVTIPIGGMTHESELVGVSHLQEAGFPGVILQELHRLQAHNPVILLDEIDKFSLGNEGTAGGALLQLLDAEQSSEFLDHYLGIPFDLSSCLFIVTANDLEEMPDALLDRLEVIEFAGYTDSEKAAVARAHLIPRSHSAAGLETWQMKLTPAALRSVIRDYTEEAGVRDLQRRLDTLARKAAVDVVHGGRGLFLRKADLPRLLGPPTVEDEIRFLHPSVGVATGLAWTSHGGSLLPIEALAMPGNGNMILTGLIGEVLRESVQTATSWVRRHLKDLGLGQDLFDSLDLHLHFPGASTPKDGPSAGIAIATALVSLITRVPARHDVAMSGEMSLLGSILPVGGLREKLLAASRSGISEVIVPHRNAAEILRMPSEIRSRMTIHLVKDVHEVLGLSLVTRASIDAPAAASAGEKKRAHHARGKPRRKRKPAG